MKLDKNTLVLLFVFIVIVVLAFVFKMINESHVAKQTEHLRVTGAPN